MKGINFILQVCTIFYATATTDGGDYTSFSVPLTFALGSGNGTQMCTSVSANADNLVEPDETLTVELALQTPVGSSFQLVNTETVVTLRDADCEYY